MGHFFEKQCPAEDYCLITSSNFVGHSYTYYIMLKLLGPCICCIEIANELSDWTRVTVIFRGSVQFPPSQSWSLMAL